MKAQKFIKTLDEICKVLNLNKHDLDIFDCTKISGYKYLSEEFAHKYPEYIDWNVYVATQYMTYEFIMQFINYIDIEHLKKNIHLDPNILTFLKFIEPAKNKSQIKNTILSEEFVKNYTSKINFTDFTFQF